MGNTVYSVKIPFILVGRDFSAYYIEHMLHGCPPYRDVYLFRTLFSVA